MDTVINMLQNNREIWRDGLMLLVGVMGLVLMAGTFRQIKKLNKNLNSITANIQAYVDVILREDGVEEETGEIMREEMVEVQEEGEKEIQKKIENLKKQEEQEKLFNAVLQEYFS